MTNEEKGALQITEYKLYKRRWAFLFTLSVLQCGGGVLFAFFGQISNVFVAFFRISYAQVDWLTLATSIGPIVLTIPFSWAIAMKWFNFRNLALTASFSATAGLVCITSSIAFRSLYPLALVGQIFNSVAGALMITAPSTFAVLWFPEHQVGTAIGVNIMSLYVGNIIGSTLPEHVLVIPTVANSTSSEQTWMLKDQTRLAAIFTSLLLTILLCDVLLFIYVTDHPPTPPTRAQEMKQKSNECVEALSFTSYSQLVKSLLKNRTYVLASFVFGILFQVTVMEFTMLPQILRQMFAERKFQYNPDIIGGYIMTAYAVGSIFGCIIGGEVVDRCKRYKVISIGSSLLTFVAAIGLMLAFVYEALPLFFAASALFGLCSQPGLVAIYEIATQETYPIDETFATVWLTGIQNIMAIFYGEIGRILFNASGGLAVLIFQSVSVLLSLLLSCLFTVHNKRLNAEKASEEGNPDRDEGSYLIARHR